LGVTDAAPLQRQRYGLRKAVEEIPYRHNRAGIVQTFGIGDKGQLFA
jgi:hypothetical protein